MTEANPITLDESAITAGVMYLIRCPTDRLKTAKKEIGEKPESRRENADDRRTWHLADSTDHPIDKT